MADRPTVLVIDNYDSFVYNLVQYLGEIVEDVIVRRNDGIDVGGIRTLEPDGIVVSPGPGRPADAGVSMAVFGELEYPALGVRLGYQALCEAVGLPVERAPAVVHGKPSLVRHDGRGIFRGVPTPLRVGRYHSLAVRPADGRAAGDHGLLETAWTAEERVLMAVRRTDRPHVGVQFHPESILTPAGARLLSNFLALT
jgi:anthranilate synthase component 2